MRLTAKDDPETIKRYSHVRPASRRGSGRCAVGCSGTAHTCTREAGHSGPHVAHGGLRRILAVWDEGGAARASSESRRRARESRGQGGLPSRRTESLLKRAAQRFVRTFSSIEEVSLFILFVAFVIFAVDWLLRILG
jgi:hypothetical protein